jgi:hypothetical protein
MCEDMVGDWKMPTAAKKRVRTTVRLPRPLYDQARDLLKQEAVNAGTINDFFVTAIGAYVEMLRRQQIDADLARMGDDPHYKALSKQLDREFAVSDWEAFANAARKIEEA